jgi:hypothetical protein
LRERSQAGSSQATARYRVSTGAVETADKPFAAGAAL